MATVKKREWVTAKGEKKSAWQVDFVDQHGGRQRKQFTTKKQADKFMAEVVTQIGNGTYRPDASKVTVKEVAEAWLESCETRQERGQRMEAATIVGYRNDVRRFILAERGVGHVKLNLLTAKAVRDFRDRLLEDGNSVSKTRRVLKTLRLVVKHAIHDDLLATNPVAGVEVLDDSRVDEVIHVPSKVEVTAAIEAASDRFRPYLTVAALCGLRASEQRALQWGDIDFEARVIHVRRRADFRNVVGEPKSSAGRRDVPAGPMVLNTLKAWRGDRIVRADELVFPANAVPQPNQWSKGKPEDGQKREEVRGGVQSHANILHRDFYPLLDKLEALHKEDPAKHPKVRRFRWHDLRHFAVSLWIEQGFNVKEIMTFAGHKDYRMTMERYGHLFPKEDHQRGMAEIEARLFNTSKKK